MPAHGTADGARQAALAEELLQEAVYRSRGEQAGAAALRAGRAGAGNCGLGEKAAVVLDLSPRAEAVFGELFPAGLADDALGRVRDVLAAWVKRQDTLDRRRNHFLKEFRLTHGFDRAAYPPERLAEFEAGLQRVNDDASAARAAAAVELLERAS